MSIVAPPRWTDQEDTDLRQMAADGMPASAIAIKMGRGRSSVCGRGRRLGLTFGGGTIRARRRAPTEASTALPSSEATRPTKRTQPPLDEAGGPIGGVLFLDARLHQCRWPISEVKPVTAFRVCGCPALDGSSYCLHHERMSRQPTPQRRRITWDQRSLVTGAHR